MQKFQRSIGGKINPFTQLKIIGYENESQSLIAILNQLLAALAIADLWGGPGC